jgi:hypothetical protein
MVPARVGVEVTPAGEYSNKCSNKNKVHPSSDKTSTTSPDLGDHNERAATENLVQPIG